MAFCYSGWNRLRHQEVRKVPLPSHGHLQSKMVLVSLTSLVLLDSIELRIVRLSTHCPA